MSGEDYRIVGKFDDVDLLAAQLADDGLHAHALHADAGANTIDIAVPALHRDFGALSGFPGAVLDGNRAVVNFGNLLFEQPHDQLGGGARDHDAGALAGLVDGLNDAAHAVADAVIFEARLFLLGEAGFGFTEITHGVRAFDALDRAVHQLADAA